MGDIKSRVFCPGCNSGRWLQMSVGFYECTECGYKMLEDTLLTYEWQTQRLWDSVVKGVMSLSGKRVFSIGSYVCAEDYVEFEGCKECPFLTQGYLWESYYPQNDSCWYYKKEFNYQENTKIYSEKFFRPLWCHCYGVTVHEEGVEPE